MFPSHDQGGEIDFILNKHDKKEFFATGFKLLCMQTISGDRSDGYKGINGIGESYAYNLLADCKTVDECCSKISEFYKSYFPEDYSYVSWDEKEMKKSWKEMMIQHCDLAYHHRGPKDKSNPLKRFLNGEYPLFKH